MRSTRSGPQTLALRHVWGPPISRALSAVSRVARGPPVPGGTFGPRGRGTPPRRGGYPPQAPKSAPWGGRDPPRPRGPEKHRFYDNLHRKSGVSYRKNRVFGPPGGPPPGGGVPQGRPPKLAQNMQVFALIKVPKKGIFGGCSFNQPLIREGPGPKKAFLGLFGGPRDPPLGGPSGGGGGSPLPRGGPGAARGAAAPGAAANCGPCRNLGGRRGAPLAGRVSVRQIVGTHFRLPQY